ncbi:MAG: hypothetical protein WAX07_06490 [Candidatus Altiarchaeia archaeon]
MNRYSFSARAKSLLTLLCIILIISTTGCLNAESEKQVDITVKSIDSASYDAAESVSQLPPLDNNTIDMSMNYKEIADRINQMITLLNREGDAFKIPQLDSSREGYEKVSKIVTKFTPLVNSYNEVVASSKKVVRNHPDSLPEFQTSSSKFALEVGLIYYAAGYKASYELVGFVYRSIGLNRLAFTCPTCVQVVLSDAHWFVRNSFIEEAGKQIDTLVTVIEKSIRGQVSIGS